MKHLLILFFTADRCIDLLCNLEHHLQRRWLRDIGLVE
jgi:hypothetical protein